MLFGEEKEEVEEGYPQEELEWLATTTFNRAVDAYCAADEEGCRVLGDWALEVAGRMTGRVGERVGELLRGRLSGLRWGE